MRGYWFANGTAPSAAGLEPAADDFVAGLHIGLNSLFAAGMRSDYLWSAGDHRAPRRGHLILVDQGESRFYFPSQTGPHGTHFHRYASLGELPPDGAGAAETIISQALAQFQSMKPFFNDDSGYIKWKPEMELERKFTFHEIPDTWQLNLDLYEAILRGAMRGYVPESDREFQVFDYTSHLFEVTGDPHEAGYISFIPQTNGLLTVKRKWFNKNSELRRESLWGDTRVAPDQFDAYAASQTAAQVRRLPSFRRKRFDVNFESLQTGNVFGVYFDICRAGEDESLAAFAQCEVEYCRTRSCFPIERVTDEWEWVCEFVSTFLIDRGTKFQRDLFSKLDFVRNAAVHATGRQL